MTVINKKYFQTFTQVTPPAACSFLFTGRTLQITLTFCRVDESALPALGAAGTAIELLRI